jgi:hypothetical protein
LTGTGRQVAVIDTAYVYTETDTGVTITTDKRFVNIRLTVTDAAGFTEFAVLALNELTGGEDWFCGLRSAHNATAGMTVGNGSGVLSLAPTAPTETINL